MAAIDFNADDVPARDNFDPIPNGEYPAVIIASEEKPTKAGTGSYLNLTFEIIEGDYAKRKVWDRLNLNNPNDVAVSIARATLSSLCKAVNVPRLLNTTQLHDLPVLIKVVQKKNDQTGDMGNEIKGYKPINPSNGSASAPKPQAAPPQQGSAPPWKRK